MDKAENFWDRQANSFDNQDEEPDSATRKTVECIKKYLNSDDTVMDYACGTGPMGLAVASQVQEVYVVDISSKMLDIAKRKASERQIENIQFGQTTLFDARFSPESFDMVLAFNILHLLENPRDAIFRINELLKPGGIFISSSACMGEKGKFLGTFLTLLSKIGVAPHVNKFTVAELEELISTGNFQMIESETSTQQVTEIFVVAKKTDSLGIHGVAYN